MILIMGGGLSGSLLAYRINQLCPDAELLLIETQPQFTTEATWSFHNTDLSSHSLQWMTPLISRSWSQQEVHFGSRSRMLQIGYHSIRSADFFAQMTTQLKKNLILGDAVHSITPDGEVTLTSGRRLRPRILFDARGINREIPLACGYQRFLGLDLELTEPHSLEHPLIMDTRCAQDEGFKFIYVLPWTKTSILIEATCYANEPDFDETRYAQEIQLYCYRNSWKIAQILRSEKAALPIPLKMGNIVNSRAYDQPQNLIPIGLNGEYFHFTTGYSLPLAVQISEIIAHEIATHADWTPNSMRRALTSLNERHNVQNSFFATLNRMLFLACEPEKRINIFQRFYTLRQGLIERFYRGELTRADQWRILLGKPPVPLFKGLKHAMNSRVIDCSWEKGITT